LDTAVPASFGPLPRFTWFVVMVGAGVFGVLMALAGRYGFHRDELYFLDAGRHLQGGYVDQPVLGPLLARVSLDLFGVSLVGLRIWPALAAWATVVVGGLIARECGGGARAQLLAAAGVATMPVVLAVDHLEGPTSVDVLAWAALALVVLRIGRTHEHRWWLVAGLILGVGLTNKHSIGIFAVAIVLGAFLSGGAQDIANLWFVSGAALAAMFTVPDLVWQAGHGWATIAMTRALNSENGGLGKLPGWVVGQLLMSTLAFVPVWIAGLRMLCGSPVALWRALAWAYGCCSSSTA
jgi:4-amino-4-deoxy-L-arabinose transferase-like glycosyltransferase